MKGFYLACVFVFTQLVLSNFAHANTWDLNIGRLCVIEDSNGIGHGCGSNYDSNWGIKKVIPDNAAFRSVMSELGVIFTPNILSAAATQGFAGFNFSLEMGWTSINRLGLSNKSNTDLPVAGSTKLPNHYYWRAAESVNATNFADGFLSDSDTNIKIGQQVPPNFASTISVMARKGFWFPVPSMELGAGFRHLLGSKMWAGVGTIKLALHEGFQRWPVPEVAGRGTVSHVFGGDNFHLTVAGVDFSISKHIGVASLFNLTPYAGYQFLWILAYSQVVYATPGIDAVAEGNKGKSPLQMAKCSHPFCDAAFTFSPQPDIQRHRFFFGLRANFYFASLLLEYSYYLAGASINSATSTPDESGMQHAINLSLAVDY